MGDRTVIEQWRPVREFAGRYEVSSLGLVRSTRGHILAQAISNSGYLCVSLWKENKGRSRFVHRLVAEAFLADFDEALQVNHRDGRKLRNALENLEMVTGSENLKHAVHVLGFRPPVAHGADNGCARPVLQLAADGSLIARHACAMDAVRLGFKAAGISECCHGNQKTHRGFRWAHAPAQVEGIAQ